MRCRFLPLLVVALVLGACAHAPEPVPESATGPPAAPIAPPMDAAVDMGALAREIRDLMMNQQAAWNAGDIPGFMAGYWESPDLVFTSGARVRRGFAETLAAYERSYRPGDMGQLYFHDLEIRPIGADGAWVLGRYRLVEREEDQVGLFTLIFRRFPEGWLIVHDHTSVAADR